MHRGPARRQCCCAATTYIGDIDVNSPGSSDVVREQRRTEADKIHRRFRSCLLVLRCSRTSVVLYCSVTLRQWSQTVGPDRLGPRERFAAGQPVCLNRRSWGSWFVPGTVGPRGYIRRDATFVGDVRGTALVPALCSVDDDRNGIGITSPTILNLIACPEIVSAKTPNSSHTMLVLEEI